MKFSICALTVSLVAASSAYSGDLLIVGDASLGNPLMSSPVFASEVAKRTSEKIKTLNLGDRVTITSFGDGRIAHIKEKSLQISRRLPPKNAAELVAGEIRSFAKSRQADGSTNLLAFFEDRDFNCKKDSTEIWVLSDAIENSSSYPGDKILKGKPLPKPFEKNLEGCKVVIIGAGLNGNSRLPRQQVQNIKKVWQDWLSKAGASGIEIKVKP